MEQEKISWQFVYTAHCVKFVTWLLNKCLDHGRISTAVNTRTTFTLSLPTLRKRLISNIRVTRLQIFKALSQN